MSDEKKDPDQEFMKTIQEQMETASQMLTGGQVPVEQLFTEEGVALVMAPGSQMKVTPEQVKTIIQRMNMVRDRLRALLYPSLQQFMIEAKSLPTHKDRTQAMFDTVRGFHATFCHEVGLAESYLQDVLTAEGQGIAAPALVKEREHLIQMGYEQHKADMEEKRKEEEKIKEAVAKATGSVPPKERS